MKRTTIKCTLCDRDISRSNYNRHYTTCNGGFKPPKKIRGIDFDPNIGFKDGTRQIWNKGLTKETHPSVMKYSQTLSINKTGVSQPGHPHTIETKDLLSIKACQRLAKNSKYSKNIEYKGVILESTFEYRTALILDELDIKWIKVRTGYIWNDNGKTRRYVPDFYLEQYDVFLDPKNDYLIKKDHYKIQNAMELNNIKVIVLSDKQINKEFLENLFTR